MKRNEIKVGREYVVKVGGKYGFTAKETVVGFSEDLRVIHTRGGYGELCKRTSRNFVKAVELAPERSMDLLVAFADGLQPTHYTLSVDAVRAAATPETRPTVRAYTDDEFGLPLLAPRAETPAERTARVYAEAMARS